MTGPRKLPTIEEYNLQQEKRKAYAREHQYERFRKYRAKHKEYSEKINKDEVTIYNKSHRIIRKALLSGELKKQPCEICGNPETEAHHKDYNYPLDVNWLCRDCHAEWHRNNTPIYAKNS